MFKKILKIISIFYKFLILKPKIRYSVFFPFQYNSRENMLKVAIEYVAASKLEGDYLEFGVYEGDTFVAAFHFAKNYNLKSMHFYAFDSFKGLPEIKGDDRKGFRQFTKGQYFCDINKFKKIISRKGVNSNKVKIISGWYDDVLNEATKKKIPLRKASVIFIDCDLYQSAVSALNFITEYIQNGSIIIFDDWFCFRGDPNKGEQRAFREWLKKNPSIKTTQFYRFGWHGNSFIIHK